VHHTITLNLPYDLSPADWEKVVVVYRSMDGWFESEAGPSWYGTEGDPQYIWASVEPSGLLLDAEIDARLWVGWISVLCAKLTRALGREVHDAEM
jgi:hypothetical protein